MDMWVRPFFALAVLLALGLTAWLGCDGVVEVVEGPAVEVQVSPAGVSISGVGATTTFRVETRNAGGNVIFSPSVIWSSLNPNVATIDDGGMVTAVTSGQVTILAEVDGVVQTSLRYGRLHGLHIPLQAFQHCPHAGESCTR